jgi:hypothetical protein
MNRKLVIGAVAGVAAVALAYGGTTYSAWSDFGDVNGNSVGAGILKLDLTSGSGGAAAPLAFGNLAPGMTGAKAVFIASSNGDSVPPADLYLTLKNVQNQDNGCNSSNSEKHDDPTCDYANDQGELARVLNVRVESFAATSLAECAAYEGGAGTGAALVPAVIKNEIGSLADPANLDKRFLVSDAAHPLTAGQGVCVTFFTYWPKNQDLAHSYDPSTLPSDNAAQGDSLTFNSHFDLIQH